MQFTTVGFVMRVVEMLNSVTHDAQVDSPLQPLIGEVLPRSANSNNEGRMDIFALEFCKEAFLTIAKKGLLP